MHQPDLGESDLQHRMEIKQLGCIVNIFFTNFCEHLKQRSLTPQPEHLTLRNIKDTNYRL